MQFLLHSERKQLGGVLCRLCEVSEVSEIGHAIYWTVFLEFPSQKGIRKESLSYCSLSETR